MFLAGRAALAHVEPEQTEAFRRWVSTVEEVHRLWFGRAICVSKAGQLATLFANEVNEADAARTLGQEPQNKLVFKL